MRRFSAENERLKRRYFTFLKEAKRQSEDSIDVVAKALSRFEAFTKYRDFKAFRVEQAVAFKRWLAEQESERTGGPLSKATLRSTQNALRNFFQWLAQQPGFRSRLSYSDAEYFNLSAKEMRIANARREGPVPTIEQINRAITAMPSASEIEQRDRAIVSLTILTGARDGAMASFKLKHIDVAEGVVRQDAREVKTKASKTFNTWFFPVQGPARQIVADWVNYLRIEKCWGLDDPLFPMTEVRQGPNHQFRAVGVARRHWSNAGPIRSIFRRAFEGAGLPYFNPHSFRKTLARLGEQMAPNPEQFKAWSQNLGHDQVTTTLTSYGSVDEHRQAEIIRALWCPQETETNRVLEGIEDLRREIKGLKKVK